MKFPSWASWAITAVGVGGYVLLWLYGDRVDPWMLQVGVIGSGYPFLVGTSGHVWNFIASRMGGDGDGDEDGTESGGSDAAEPVASTDGERVRSTDGGALQDGDEATNGDRGGQGGETGRAEPDRDVGFVVGKCENVLILTFMVVGAYTALAVVFAAKSIVRRKDMQNDSKYYLAGTMTNVTYSVAVGVGVRVLLQVFDAWPVVFLTGP